MKRLQIVQSSIEPDKNVLWLDKDKNLKIYNGDGWETISNSSSIEIDIVKSFNKAFNKSFS
jgi:hypothetical protein